MGGNLGGIPFNRARADELIEGLHQRLYRGPLLDEGEYVIAGSYRRGKMTLGDLDIIVLRDDWNNPHFVREVWESLGLDVTRNQHLTKKCAPRKALHFLVGGSNDIVRCGDGRTGHQIDLYFAPPKSEGAFLLFLTGSKDFNVWQRRRAKRMGFTLTQWGIAKNGHGDCFASTEEAICKLLEMQWPPPAARETGNYREWNSICKERW